MRWPSPRPICAKAGLPEFTCWLDGGLALSRFTNRVEVAISEEIRSDCS